MRVLGKTQFNIAEIGLGTWQVGGKWGDPFDRKNAAAIIEKALELGINFIDTADVYSGGESESAVARAVKSAGKRIYVATKCGRRLNPHNSAAYTTHSLRAFVEDSLQNTGFDALDLIQLHCPPTEVYYRPEIFDLFDRLKEEGKILNLGVSVEKVEEGLKAIEYPNVTTVQIIFNMFRQRPAELFFREAKKRDVGVIVRVPLASGLLSGKFTRETTFGKDDHRSFNRKGEAFDRGETFAGIDYDTGLKAVDELKALLGNKAPLAAQAIRWILMFPEVSCVIPGASRPEQVTANTDASALKPLTETEMKSVQNVYEKYIKPSVHHYW